MRPLHLRLAAFGSYPAHESVDFVALAVHGLFVVSGPTGSGKTTLFDAMTYALYGSLPGDRPDDVRSHHAASTVDTEVELTFEAEGRTYRVRRTPKQDRPKARGAGTTTVAATAQLYEVTPTGDVALANGKRDVDPVCAELVGLNCDQFQRVVLLPQGKCAQFLLCKSDERQALLQQLFGTRLFERATQLAQDRAAELRRDLAERDAEADRHRKNALDGVALLAGELIVDADSGEHLEAAADLDIDAIEVLIATLTPLLASERRRLDDLSLRSLAASAALATADSVAAQWRERERLNDEHAELEAQRADVELQRVRLSAAGRAAPVVAADSRVTVARIDLERNDERLRDVVADLETDFEALGLDRRPATATGAVAQLAIREARVSADEQRLDELHNAEDVANHLAAELATTTAAVEQLDVVLAEISPEQQRLQTRVDELHVVAGGVEQLERAAEHSKDLVERAEEQASDEHSLRQANEAATVALADRLRITAAFIADAAPRLADELTAGQPCPVCGSTEHPTPAARHAHEPVGRDELDRAVEASQRADASVHTLAVRLGEHRRVLGDRADDALSSLRDEYVAHKALLSAARQAVAELTQRRAELTKLEDAGRDALAQRQQLITDSAGTTGALAGPTREVERLRAEVGDIDAEVVARQRVALAAAKSAVSLLAATESEREGVLGVLKHVEQQCAAALIESGFASTTEARAVAMPADEIFVTERKLAEWQQRCVEVDIQLTKLREVDLGEVCPDTQHLRLEAEALVGESRVATNLQSQRDLRLNDANVAVSLSRAVFNDAEDLRAARATAERVATMCVGRNRINVALETWVLAGELERVTHAANVHLERMTRGRYRLQRSGDADDRRRRGGLDLVVLDSDTGKPRVPGTLSGGEQFQASLALALGLADVVSQGGSGSGKVFEALFVDEGFGSLDPQALDEAIDALHELHATGRMVGVITHVETMKQQLPIGIEVLVRADGVGSTLRQP